MVRDLIAADRNAGRDKRLSGRGGDGEQVVAGAYFYLRKSRVRVHP
jgi:hypothetical protein